jgi:hypothetical protein
VLGRTRSSNKETVSMLVRTQPLKSCNDCGQNSIACEGLDKLEKITPLWQCVIRSAWLPSLKLHP